MTFSARCYIACDQPDCTTQVEFVGDYITKVEYTQMRRDGWNLRRDLDDVHYCPEHARKQQREEPDGIAELLKGLQL